MKEIFENFVRSPVTLIYVAGYSFWLLTVGIELAVSEAQGRRVFSLRDTAANLIMYAGYFFINIFWVYGVYGIYGWAESHAIFQLGTGTWHLGGGNLWWEWIALFLLEDLCFYAFHRASHRLRFFWAAHVTHHSSEKFNLSVALRQTWTPFVAVIFWVPLPLLGFDPLMVMTMQTVSLFYQVWLHTQLVPNLGPLEWIFNTPRHHQVHHGSNVRYVDKNLGGILIIWDRIFGTYEKLEEPVRFGLHENLGSYNPLRIAFHEWAAIGRDLLRSRSARDVWKAVRG